MYAIPEKRKDAPLMIGILVTVVAVLGAGIFLVKGVDGFTGGGDNAPNNAAATAPGQTDASEDGDTNEYEVALASADRAIELNPFDAGAQFARGNALLSLGRVDESIAALERATQIDAANARHHAVLGRAYLENGELEAGVTALRTAQELAPNDPVIKEDLDAAVKKLDGDIESESQTKE